MSRIAAALIAVASLQAVDAQEFRVVTTIRDLSVGEDVRGISTLTLFRHRKVYDYIAEMGEVIIYEPGANRFTILNTRRGMATSLNFDEIKHLLKKRQPRVEQYVAGLRANADPVAADVEASLQFQLNPKFEESWDGGKNELTLRSPKCSYRVRCAEQESPEQATQYLAYADWMARLNSILHPAAMFPEPRIALNSSLRRRRRLPQTVELSSSLDGKLHLEASHRIAFKLEDTDRHRITGWESALSSPRVSRVSFKDYQRAILASR